MKQKHERQHNKDEKPLFLHNLTSAGTTKASTTSASALEKNGLIVRSKLFPKEQCPQNQQQLQFDGGSQSLEPNSEQSIERNVLLRHRNCDDGIGNHTILEME